MTVERLKTKAIGKIASMQVKVGALMTAATTEMIMNPTPTFAKTNVSSKKGETAIWNIIEMILNFTTILGIVFAFMGLWKLIQAFRNDNNPEAMAGGAKDLMVGFLLIALKAAGKSGLKHILGIR